MHMPMKLRLVVLVTVAVCVGAFYVLVVRPERVGTWQVHQGGGRLEEDPRGGESYLDVKYRVSQPEKPLLSFLGLSAADAENDLLTMVLEYQSERRTALVMTITERDGSMYQARLKLERTDTWRRLVLEKKDFEPRGDPHEADENGMLDLEQLTRRVDFYDDSSVKSPTTVFENRLKLTAPVLAEKTNDATTP